MSNYINLRLFTLSIILIVFLSCLSCSGTGEPRNEKTDLLSEFEKETGLQEEYVSYEHIIKGTVPANFLKYAFADYKPSYNEDPSIPIQCWVETNYGSQNACKYCHTNYLSDIKHGNSFPIAEDQILYNFASPNLNKINWKNVISPQEINERLEKENIKVPEPNDPENLIYIRKNNWKIAFLMARPYGDDSWNNVSNAGSVFQLFPALNPEDLLPFTKNEPTDIERHGHIDREGFVKNKYDDYTGWRAVNFFPYAIFTPLTGSVSGIYIRLPKVFMTKNGITDIEIYKKNLDLLEKNIKNESTDSKYYYGDASNISIKKGFYPVGTEFAHTLHYVDLNADGEVGTYLDGLYENAQKDYEFPGTRSKRVKEIRYMYKWKDVDLDDIAEKEDEGEEIPKIIGQEGKGWIENGAGWILSAYIENRKGGLRPQTTEELLQCKGCHSSVGNTVDAVWSFQRKLPGDLGWQEMNYGFYKKSQSDKTQLHDYYNENASMGELEYFYYTVVGADLFGVMPAEIKSELIRYAEENNLVRTLGLQYRINDIFDDEKLKSAPKAKRKQIIHERSLIMRQYASSWSYLYKDSETGKHYIKGNIFYPTESTMLANIAAYRRIVLDQSYNLGKNVFGTQPEQIPFTFRSDGTILNSERKVIPLGHIIDSRPWNEDGIGITPTKIVKVNEKGEPVDENGNVVDIEVNPENAVGHISKGGTFETKYNPILTNKPIKK